MRGDVMTTLIKVKNQISKMQNHQPRERDTLLEVLGDDAFGSIYELHGIRVGGADDGRPSSAPADRNEKNEKNEKKMKRRQSNQSTGRPAASSDEEWSAEKDAATVKNAVKARRRLLVSQNGANAGSRVLQGPGSGVGVASLAARAGEQVGASPRGTVRVNDGDKDNDDDNERGAGNEEAGRRGDPDQDVNTDGNAGVVHDQRPSSSSPASSAPSSSLTPIKKPARKKKKASGASRTRREASGVLINGKMVHSISGVPDEFLLDMASLPQSQRPKRCGQCGSCLNPMRKKACEVMRALGTNPPIPRGKNREKLLGTNNFKKHVPRSYGSEVPDVTKLKHRGADDEFTEPEFQRLLQALVETHPNINHYWTKVARMVGTKDEQACFQRVYQSDAYYKERERPKQGAGRNPGGGADSGRGVHGSDSAGVDADDDGFIERVLQRRRIGFGDGLQARRSSGDHGGDHGGDLAGNHEGSTVDHTRVRDLVEHELAGLATTGAMSSSDTESL